ncbi:hypothetical protein F4558_003024 [Micromonospora profundi]|uniref:hypothetical protein n=1 Tax=Micromonospora profundi TaxID=1420889 RepID=UPI00143A4B9B|nr:hypothetical protein [Micromonospora profundi]NJC13198.1 hypothetical protein [Micromonospora profundi]
MRRILNRLSLSTTTNASVLLGPAAQAIAGAPDLLAVNNLPTVINNLVVWIVGILVGVPSSSVRRRTCPPSACPTTQPARSTCSSSVACCWPW